MSRRVGDKELTREPFPVSTLPRIDLFMRVIVADHVCLALASSVTSVPAADVDSILPEQFVCEAKSSYQHIIHISPEYDHIMCLLCSYVHAQK